MYPRPRSTIAKTAAIELGESIDGPHLPGTHCLMGFDLGRDDRAIEVLPSELVNAASRIEHVMSDLESACRSLEGQWAFGSDSQLVRAVTDWGLAWCEALSTARSNGVQLAVQLRAAAAAYVENDEILASEFKRLENARMVLPNQVNSAM